MSSLTITVERNHTRFTTTGPWAVRRVAARGTGRAWSGELQRAAQRRVHEPDQRSRVFRAAHTPEGDTVAVTLLRPQTAGVVRGYAADFVAMADHSKIFPPHRPSGQFFKVT